MHLIDMETWARREHFRVYGALEYPYFGITVDLDATGFLPSLKEAGLPVYPAIIHAAAQAANEIEEFRTRIRGDAVVLHDSVAPSFTVPWRDTLFSFCAVAFEPDRERFVRRCLEEMDRASQAESLIQIGEQRDDLLFMTCFPWRSFTGMTHPASPSAKDSIPRLAWGKVTRKEGRDVLPFNLMMHHGLADGLHAARFFTRLEALLTAPQG